MSRPPPDCRTERVKEGSRELALAAKPNPRPWGLLVGPMLMPKELRVLLGL